MRERGKDAACFIAVAIAFDADLVRSCHGGPVFGDWLSFRAIARKLNSRISIIAAGPVGAIVGGTIGGVVGGINRILGVDERPRFRHYVVEEHRPSYRYEGYDVLSSNISTVQSRLAKNYFNADVPVGAVFGKLA